jgi:hypothetical protein
MEGKLKEGRKERGHRKDNEKQEEINGKESD